VTSPLLGLAGFLACLLLIALRVPVAIAMGVTGAIGFGLLNGRPGVGFVIGTAPFEAVFPYGLSVVPLFILMGIFAARSGLSRALYDAFAMLGHRRGGLRWRPSAPAPGSAPSAAHPWRPPPRWAA
jgi:TRAP-type mannitol/chloroaromatic compound transport system permease large subunit